MRWLSTFHFLHPAWLAALLPLLCLAVWLSRDAQRKSNWSQIVDAELLALLRVSEGAGRHSPWLLLGLIWLLAVLALAGPSWRREQSAAFRAPAAWVVVLDLSPSMNATDLAPDRVTRTRYAITDLLAAARDARVGLVVFAGEPHTVSPLTTDVATVRVLLQPLAPSLMPESGDRLAPALEEAGRLLPPGVGQHAQVIVFSDGFGDTVEALNAAQQLRKQGTTVHVVGVGTEAGAPEPDGNGGFVRDIRGRPHLSRMQADELQRVATGGGGHFVKLSELKKLLETLSSDQSRGLDASETAPETQLATWRNEGIWLLPPLLLLAAMLARRGWL